LARKGVPTVKAKEFYLRNSLTVKQIFIFFSVSDPFFCPDFPDFDPLKVRHIVTSPQFSSGAFSLALF